jgi:hypothetical protein
MPALPAVPKVVRLDYHMQFASDLNCETRTFWQYPGALTLADAQTWVNACRSAWGAVTHYAGMVSAEVTLLRTVLTDLSSNTAPQVEDDTQNAGQGVGNALANGSAAVIKFHILRRYRGGHPRMYVPGMLASALTTGGVWTAGQIANLQAGWSNTVSAIIAGAPAAVGVPAQVNVSYYAGFTNHTYPSGRTRPIPTPRVTPLIDLVTGFSINPKVGSQRRRNLQSS